MYAQISPGSRWEIKTHKLLVMIALALMILCQLVHGAEYIREVPASVILAMIEKGEPVKCDSVIINGDLDIAKINLSTNNGRALIIPPMIITNSRINGNLSFFRSNFRGNVNFVGSQFNGYANFEGSQFSGPARFDKSQFNGSTDFHLSQFNDYAVFINSQFNGSVDFTLSQFNEPADFEESKFEGNASFSASKFGGISTIFLNSQFNHSATFSGSQFNGDVDFSGCQFKSYAYFQECTFNGIAVFASPRSQFKGKVDFSLSQFNKNVIDWVSIETGTFDKTSYLSLIKCLRDNGMYDEANDCYISYRSHYMSNIFDYLSWYTCGGSSLF